MRNNIRYTPLFLALLLISCGVARPVPVQTDSTRVEVRTQVVHQIDTAYVELPVIVEKVATLDTASVLENKYAKSEAVISSGILSHSLSTKAVKQPVAVQKEIVFRDSLVYRDRVDTVTVEVEKKLTGWQKAKLRVGGFCFFALILIALYFIITQFINLKFF